jgi:hypothetical protein
MAVVFEFIRGMNLGVEFPGDGIYVVLHLGPVRVMFVTRAIIDEFYRDEA